MSPLERSQMIRKNNTDLSLTRQCKLLKISHSSICYSPVSFDQVAINLMHESPHRSVFTPVRFRRRATSYTPSDRYHEATDHL